VTVSCAPVIDFPATLGTTKRRYAVRWCPGRSEARIRTSLPLARFGSELVTKVSAVGATVTVVVEPAPATLGTLARNPAVEPAIRTADEPATTIARRGPDRR
jgi:hypothetical protein